MLNSSRGFCDTNAQWVSVLMVRGSLCRTNLFGCITKTCLHCSGHRHGHFIKKLKRVTAQEANTIVQNHIEFGLFFTTTLLFSELVMK